MKTPFKSRRDYEYAMTKLGQCVGDVLTAPNTRRATAFISPTLTIKATAQRRPDGRGRSATALVTIGAPNFAERRFIRVCQKAGEQFPLKRIQWKFWPKKGARK